MRHWLVVFLSVLASLSLGSAAVASTSITPAVSGGSVRFELQVPVLYYHRIKCLPAGASDPSLYECPDVFAEQLGYLRDHGWSTLTTDDVADLMAGRACPDPKKFVVTIDDGTLDGYTAAAPILDSLGMHATYFIVVQGAHGSRDAGLMSWDQIRDLLARGHAIGNHTLSHKSLKTKSAAVVYDQIEGAQQAFDAQLGFRPRTLAYPYGRYSATVLAQAAASGFELAFTVRPRVREASDDLYRAGRLLVGNTETGAHLLARLAPFADGCRPPTPDLAVALDRGGPFVGQGLLKGRPIARQTVRRKHVSTAHPATFAVQLENLAQVAGAFRLQGIVQGAAGMKVKATAGGTDITSALVTGAYTTPILQPWATMVIDVSITPSHAGTPGDATKLVVNAFSTLDASRIDAGRLVAIY